MIRDRLVLRLPSAGGSRASRLLRTARLHGIRSFAASGSSPPSRPGERWFTGDARRLRPRGEADGPAVDFHEVRDPGELLRLLATAPEGRPVGLRWAEGRVIPLELAIARRPTGGELWVEVGSASDAPAVAGALEQGADRVVVPADDVDELVRLLDRLDPRLPTVRWRWATVDSVEPVGTSERVLVDTIALLGASEGLLVGSQAAALFHVRSEATGTRFSGPRPFRVNAGSPHLYVLLPDGRTRYLSELEAGDPVAVVAAGGGVRSVRVGRIKIERRPMSLVRARLGTERATVILQEAESVRLSGRRREVAVTDLREGVSIRASPQPPARHLGIAVDETIHER